LWQRLRSHETVAIPTTAVLPPDAAATAGLMNVLELGSMLAVPLTSGSRL
ncbi:MAG: hypothetical protein GWO04_08010, partial [Actinobacteria bacterium]|nr:hypothetical protein [Actinomycetota bacterium]